MPTSTPTAKCATNARHSHWVVKRLNTKSHKASKIMLVLKLPATGLYNLSPAYDLSMRTKGVV